MDFDTSRQVMDLVPGGAEGEEVGEGDLSISSRKSTPPQNRQLNVLISNSKQQVDNFVGGVDFLKTN